MLPSARAAGRAPVTGNVKRQHAERMLSISISKGELPSKGVPFHGMRELSCPAASKVMPARRRQQLAGADRHSKAASTRSSTFWHVLPLNSAAHADARARVVLCNGHRARAGGCER
ncbi:MAG: hypothetical protein AMJ67_12505 [Betaproteobacteria bacterium SG8_41]|nr:MAG: hypothetical protein AMJ67_12505 [Betaproteobacteria bacterium SG8_41]